MSKWPKRKTVTLKFTEGHDDEVLALLSELSPSEAKALFKLIIKRGLSSLGDVLHGSEAPETLLIKKPATPIDQLEGGTQDHGEEKGGAHGKPLQQRPAKQPHKPEPPKPEPPVEPVEIAEPPAAELGLEIFADDSFGEMAE